MRLFIPMITVTTIFVLAASASAKPEHAGGKGKGNGNDKHAITREHSHHGNSDKVLVSLDDPSIHSIADRLQPYYTRKCPPGLAKKHNGCLPPGHARGYRIGEPLIGGYWPVPGDVAVLLPRAPYGSRYVWVDRDILLISEATKKVLDAVVILSGVN